MGAAEVNLYFLLRPLELHISNPINNNTIYFNCQLQLLPKSGRSVHLQGNEELGCQRCLLLGNLLEAKPVIW